MPGNGVHHESTVKIGKGKGRVLVKGRGVFAMGYKKSVRCLYWSVFLGSSICENSLGTGSRY